MIPVKQVTALASQFGLNFAADTDSKDNGTCERMFWDAMETMVRREVTNHYTIEDYLA